MFVDDELYQKTVKDGAIDPIEDIQNLVFAYMNSVSEPLAKYSQCIYFFDEKMNLWTLIGLYFFGILFLKVQF